MISPAKLAAIKANTSKPRPGSRGNQRGKKHAEHTGAVVELKISKRVIVHRRAIQKYVAGVRSGSVVAGKLVKQAVDRYVSDRARFGEDGFSEDLAVRAINFIEDFCTHTMGATHVGKPFKLEPWEKFILWNVFGFQEGGVRRFRYALISIGRKNGKSIIAVAILLYCFVADRPLELRAPLLCASTKVEQSQNVIFDELVAMRNANPELRRLLALYQSRVEYEAAGTKFRSVSSDKAYDGLGPHLVVLDELHAWREVHRKFFDTMRTGSGTRLQPLLLVTTTAGDDASLLYNEQADYAGKVLDGTVDDDEMFAFIASLDIGDDPFDEANWPKANPNLDVCLYRRYLRSQAKIAQSQTSMRNAFLRYHCNVRTGSSEAIISPEAWSLCEGYQDGTPVATHGGFDLARSNDFAAWAIVRVFDNGGYDVISQSYTCRERTADMSVPFIQDWVDSGELVEHAGNSIDYDQFEHDLKAATLEHGVATWAYDPTFAHQMGQHLVEEFGEDVPFKFTQSARHYNESFRKLEQLVSSGGIRHGGGVCLAWQASNLMAKRNPRDEWMPDKSASKSKIDAMVAMLMALSECLFAERETEWTAEELGV